MQEKTILLSRPVRIRDVIRALQVYVMMPTENSAEGEEQSHLVLPAILTGTSLCPSHLFF